MGYCPLSKRQARSLGVEQGARGVRVHRLGARGARRWARGTQALGRQTTQERADEQAGSRGMQAGSRGKQARSTGAGRALGCSGGTDAGTRGVGARGCSSRRGVSVTRRGRACAARRPGRGLGMLLSQQVVHSLHSACFDPVLLSIVPESIFGEIFFFREKNICLKKKSNKIRQNF